MQEIYENHLVNYKNYYIYGTDVMNKTTPKIYVPQDISITNIDDHIDGVNNILKDGIETDFVHNMRVYIYWTDSLGCHLSLPDYWFNLFMWAMILKTNHPILPKHIFWGDELKRKDLKQYVDANVLTLENKININIVELNHIIADGFWYYSYIEKFAYYLANTINNEDDIDLMRACPEFDELIHCSLKGYPIEDVKNEGMKITNRAIELIKNSRKLIGYDHGLANSFKASEAINPRQYKEASLNIGTKPNGSGGVYPHLIDKNFKTGGVNDATSYFIESASARTAQIYSKNNVGESGDFARLVGLNNTDTILNPDPDFECLSQHFIKFEIKTRKHLSMIKHRCYRNSPRGIDYYIDHNDLSMIGKTVYLHSPMTCSSNSSGHGICRKCYGTLYYINRNINIGKIAAEILSSQLTQTLLSAKHLLETKIVSVKWSPEFKDWFDIDINTIKLSESLDEDIDLKKWTMVIDPEDVQLVNEEEDAISYDDEGNEILSDIDDSGVYNEYITGFILKSPDGDDIYCTSEDQTEMYISNELNQIIRKKASNTDGKVNIPLNNLVNSVLFYIKINNNEISKTMNDIINVINKSSVTEKMTKDEALQTIVDLIIDGNLSIDSVHLEVILSNQIVRPDDILQKPNWNDPNAKYRMFTLNQALTNNPSVIISLLYKDLHRVLYNPLTFSKHAPSFFDLFFCEQPQVYMSDDLYVDQAPEIIKDQEEKIIMYTVEAESKEDEIMRKIEEDMSPEELAECSKIFSESKDE